LALIRSCYNKRANNPEFDRLTWALLGVASPTDLCRDKNLSSNTPFNIGKAIELTGFDETEAQPLAAGLAELTDKSGEVLREVLYWTGGQPFLTQKLCKLLFENAPPPAPPCQGGESELSLAGASPKGVYADLAVVDVSFISLDKVLPALWELLAPPREAVLLVKPQFEVGRDRVGKKGVVRDSATQADAIFQVWKAASALGWQEKGLTWSPLLGPAGNIEYLLWLGIDREPEPDESAIEESVVKERIAQVAKAAARELVNRL